LGGAPPARAASPVAGNWRVTVLPPGQELTLALVKIAEADGKLELSVLALGGPDPKAAPDASSVAFDSVQADDKALRMSLRVNGISFSLVAHLPPGDPVPRRLLGSLEARGRRDLLRLDRTEGRTLDPNSVAVRGPAAEAFHKAQTAEGPKEKEAAFREILGRFQNQPVAFHAAIALVELGVEGDVPESELRQRADRAVRLAFPYGREMELQARYQVAGLLMRAEKLRPLALEYARQAEKLLSDSDPAAVQVRVLKLVAMLLRQSGKSADADALRERVARLDDRLDQDYARTLLPFQPEPFPGRKAAGGRTVLLEVFTGCPCPPCVAADVACEAIRRTFESTDVILLRYHTALAGPDPLANADAEKRAEFYTINSVPVVLVNGRLGPAAGGFLQHARDVHAALRRTVEEQLDTPAEARLHLRASRHGDQVTIEADVADLKRPETNVRLRFAVVEEVVRYPAMNGLRLHHQVVRALPGGVEGFPVKAGGGRQTVAVDLAELRRTLTEQLAELAKADKSLEQERMLDLGRLKIVAIVQGQKTKDVLQAAQVDVPVGR
jgi:hypothetical protein